MLKDDILKTNPMVGTVRWIGLRPARKTPLQPVESVELNTEQGLVGDHYSGKSGKRQVTLIQGEHLTAVGSLLGRGPVDPGLTRRNIVVEGINLYALKDQRFRIGNTVLEMTGVCYPCSRMEENLGKGGYQAMRGHGGMTARVIQGGTIQLGDAVIWLEAIPAEADDATA